MKKTIILVGMLISACLQAVEYTEQSPLFYGTYTENFVIRWGYQERCHFIHDKQKKWPTAQEGITFDPKAVQPGDILFVRNVYWFFRNINKHIDHPYILVTAGEYIDRVVKKNYQFLGDDKLIAWFTVHPHPDPHPKIHHLPLGIYQLWSNYEQREERTDLFAQLRQQPKEGLLYMNFRGGTTKPYRADRDVVYNMFKDAPFCYKARRLSFLKYMKQMARYKFVLSPRGTAPDTYRTWEALLVGSIPVVKSSQLDALYADLPVLIVKQWQDVTPELLEKTWQEFTTKRFNIEKLTIEYWWSQIENTRKEFLASLT